MQYLPRDESQRVPFSLAQSLAIDHRVWGANMEATLLGAYVAAQANGYQFKLINIPDSVQLGPDSFDFDSEIMKVLFEKGRDLGRNPSSWVAAPSPGQNASPWLIKLLNELRRER